MVTSGFHLWQYQLFNTGAEELVVVLFWLDLWKIFLLATPGFELWTSGSLVLHSTTVPWWLLVFTSDNFRYLNLVQRDWWRHCLNGPVRDFLYDHTRVWSGDLWISSPALYHCATVTSGFHLWQFKVFKSGAEGLVMILFWLVLWEIFFLATLGFEPGTSGSLVLHSMTVPLQPLVFTSDNFRYLTLVQRDCGGIVLIGPVRDFLFGDTRVELGTSGSLVVHSTTVPWHLPDFHLWQVQVFISGAEGLVVVLFWLDLWKIFFLATPGFELWTSGSLVLHSTTVP